MKYHHEEHYHSDIEGGQMRAFIFGMSDGLVSNLALIIGFAGAAASFDSIILAGLIGMIGGAISMASGEWLSVKSQTEMAIKEKEKEKQSITLNSPVEEKELFELWKSRGLDDRTNKALVEHVHSDKNLAVAIHMKEELGVNIESLDESFGSAEKAAATSFIAFVLGSSVPLLPYLLSPVWKFEITVFVSAIVAILFGSIVGKITEKPVFTMSLRYTVIIGFSVVIPFLIGGIVTSILT